jgi:tetratricopeptide (TPR) repeat protein
VYNQAYLAIFNNRPREAFDALLSLGSERGPMRGWWAYFNQFFIACLELGEHEKLMEAAQKYRAAYGVNYVVLGHEGLSLAALGRVEEVNARVDEIAAMPGQGRGILRWIINIATQLRRYGHIDAAQATIERAMQWYEANPAETRSSEAWRSDYALALYIANRCGEAYPVAKALSEEFPENLNRRGLVGVLAACRGDRQEALEVTQWLRALDRPYLRGNHTMWRSMIAGALGDGESAVALLRQALAEGQRHPPPWSHAWIAFEPLREYPPFQELMRPKG